MPDIPQGWRLSAAVLVVCLLLPRFASAQDLPFGNTPDLRPSLRIPTVAASVAAAADWASTYHALTNYHVRETNVLLQPFQSSPGTLVTIGAAIDIAGFTAWNKFVGPRNPKLAATGMWAMAGFRAFLAIRNIRNEQQALRRVR